jgi:hypothetical protein
MHFTKVYKSVFGQGSWKVSETRIVGNSNLAIELNSFLNFRIGTKCLNFRNFLHMFWVVYDKSVFSFRYYT